MTGRSCRLVKPSDSVDIVALGTELLRAACEFSARARAFFYELTLAGESCSACGGGLCMEREGVCRCMGCDLRLDPTAAFQTCSSCGGSLVVRVRRYVCSRCGADITSRFLFDGLVFDPEYFRQKMAEHRQRVREQREQMAETLTASRSGDLALDAAELAILPDLTAALDALVSIPAGRLDIPARERFDLNRYQEHVQSCTGPIAIALEQIPPLSENTRLDRVWRFIAIIFLAHRRLVEIWQDKGTIQVRRYESN